MDPETMIALSDAVSKKSKRVAELMAIKAERSLSRRERAEMTTIAAEIEELRKQVDVDPRALQWNARIATRGDKDGNTTLTREQGVADWLRERGEYRSGLGGLSEDDREHLSIGKMVRGAVTGNWKDAELEQPSDVGVGARERRLRARAGAVGARHRPRPQPDAGHARRRHNRANADPADVLGTSFGTCERLLEG